MYMYEHTVIRTLFTQQALVPIFTPKTMTSLYVAAAVITAIWTRQGTVRAVIIGSRATYGYIFFLYCSSITVYTFYWKSLRYTFSDKVPFCCMPKNYFNLTQTHTHTHTRTHTRTHARTHAPTHFMKINVVYIVKL